MDIMLDTHKYLFLAAEVPPDFKNFLYYFVITFFVLSIVFSTILTGAFLVILVLLWENFKTIKYYWFLTQLTITVFILSTLNLVVNVPATMFSWITKEFVASELYSTLSYTMDYLHYAILFSNLVIAIQRFSVFFLSRLRIFDSFFIYLWLILIWLLPCSIMYVMLANKCRYVYTKEIGHYFFNCDVTSGIIDLEGLTWMRAFELILQFGIPLFIFGIYLAIIVKIVFLKKSSLNKQEIRVLIQAVVVFVLFQISSTIFLYCQTVHFLPDTAFIIKRIINATHIFFTLLFLIDSNTFDYIKTRIASHFLAEIPPYYKSFSYYAVITFFVLSIVASTILTGGFLALLVLLWDHFKKIKYYWFLAQLTIFVFILSTLNLVVNVPATMFSWITQEFVASELYSTLSYIMDYLHYAILFSNLVIAIQRFSVFFFSKTGIFDSCFIYIWLIFIWISPSGIVFVMVYNQCKYIFTDDVKHFFLKCEISKGTVDLPEPMWIRAMELILQFGIPLVILVIYLAIIVKIVILKKTALNKQEMRVLIQAIVIFVLFQISSTVFLYCQTISFKLVTAFIIKRIINASEIFAGAATPCFSFFMSTEIRKLLSTKISTMDSRLKPNTAVRISTLAEIEN